MENKRIPQEEFLYRRGYATPERRFMNPDGSATSRVFKLREKDNGKLSVDVKSLTTPEKAITNQNEFMLFEVSVSNVESIGLDSFYDPILPENPAHAFIYGMDIDDETKALLLAKKARRVFIKNPT